LFITFVLIGLWHGAHWTFVAMGALFGVYLTVGSITEGWRKKIARGLGLLKVPWLYHALQTLTTFALVAVAWIFFRAETIAQALGIIGHLGSGLVQLFSPHYIRYELLGFPLLGASTKAAFVPILLAIVGMEAVQYLQEKGGTLSIWERWPRAWRF